MATPAMGYKSYLGYAREVTWGTAVPASNYLEVLSENLKYEFGRIFYGGARSLSYKRHFQGKTFVSGGFQAEVFFEGFLEIWRHLLNSSIATGYTYTLLASGAKQHEFEMEDTPLTGLTLRVGRDLEEAVYEGCKINKGTFDFAVDEPVKFTAEVIGEEESSTTVGSPTFPSNTLLIDHAKVTVKYDTSAKDCQTAQVVFDNAMGSDRRTLGDAKILEPQRTGVRHCTGTVGLEFTSTADYDLFRNATEKKIDILCEGAVIADTDKYTLQLEMNKVVFTGDTPNVEGPGPIKLNMPFEAFYDSGGSQDTLKITVISTEAELT